MISITYRTRAQIGVLLQTPIDLVRVTIRVTAKARFQNLNFRNAKSPKSKEKSRYLKQIPGFLLVREAGLEPARPQ